jgi:3-hydroxyisobutyrate dehydrogenase-like beta-hydroxyacid dehydrogenase
VPDDGGDPSLVERCRPVLQTTASNIYTVGAIGMGALAKVAQNLITAQFLVAASEGFRLAGKGGVDLEVFQEIVRTSSAQSWVADDYLSFWGNQPRPGCTTRCSRRRWISVSMMSVSRGPRPVCRR